MKLYNLNNDADFWRLLCFILLFLLGFMAGTDGPIIEPKPAPVYIPHYHDDPWLDRERRTI
jgi:hypothetical protein